jgi:hypothetical protein
MRYRFLASTAPGLLIAALVLFSAVAGDAQTAATRTARKPGVPRTADGRPDLQGTWDFRTITPLERPSALGGKQTLTDEEAAEVEQQAAKDRIDRPPAKGDPGTYNQFWFDRGTKVIGDRRTSLIIDPPDGRIPALTPEGQKRRAAGGRRDRPAGPEDRNVAERCILGFNAGPPMEPRAYNNNLQLIQTRDYVVIVTEMVHDARIIPLDGRPHGRIRQWRGDSRGRWEGDTLVVDTINFDKSTAFSERQGSTRAMHLVERFTRVDANTLQYEFTVEDPATWTKPWTAAIPMTRSDEKLYEYACHEGNYAMPAMLAGARAEEAAERAKSSRER